MSILNIILPSLWSIRIEYMGSSGVCVCAPWQYLTVSNNDDESIKERNVF